MADRVIAEVCEGHKAITEWIMTAKYESLNVVFGVLLKITEALSSETLLINYILGVYELWLLLL